MNGLANVWVCAENLKVFRADRIVSLYVPDAADWEVGADHAEVAVMAKVTGDRGDDSAQDITLLKCPKSLGPFFIAELALALGTTTDSKETQFVLPYVKVTGSKVTNAGWRLQTSLAAEAGDVPRGIGRFSRELAGWAGSGAAGIRGG
jgi:hypothetical protein